MLIKNILLSIVILCLTLIFLFPLSSNLDSQTRDWEQLYQILEDPVFDMNFSNISGISEYGLLFALPVSGGGLAYFTNPDSLNVFNFVTNLGAVSIVPDNSNDRIFCAFGCYSNSDGLYKFDMTTHDFELIGFYGVPHFVKKLSSGFYYGYGFNNIEGGLLHSANGDNWSGIEFFNFKVVTDVEEIGDGTLFVAADNDIYIENNGNFNSFPVGLYINDIYVRNYPNDSEVYLACGFGGYVFKVIYDNGEITDLITINMFNYPNRIYEYEDFLVVGCKNGGGLYLVEPEENGQVQQIGSELGINNVYCFEFYPIYTPNFMVGTDVGVFLATNLGTDSDQNLIKKSTNITAKNFPNPFNPTTTIEFSLQNDSKIDLSLFNIKGQKIKTLANDEFAQGTNSIVWNGDDDYGKLVSSGIYYYKLDINGNTEAIEKCLLLK